MNGDLLASSTEEKDKSSKTHGNIYQEGEKKAKRNTARALWARIIKNPDCSTGSLTCLFARD